MELTRLIQHPEEMNKETLYDLRELLALYPYYQTARLLMLQNLYLLHDASFDEELRRAAIYITDRKVIFQMVEAAHYQLKKESNAAAGKKDNTADRTSDLIDNFLESIPADKEDEEKKKEKRKPTPADAAVDYVAYLLETEGETEEENSSRTISLIDDFMEDGGFKLPKIDVSADYQLSTNLSWMTTTRKNRLKIVEYLLRLWLVSILNRENTNVHSTLYAVCMKSIQARACIMLTRCDSWKN